jgi:hypothetical protein
LRAKERTILHRASLEANPKKSQALAFAFLGFKYFINP